MKVIFLDFDGVINSFGFNSKPHISISIEKDINRFTLTEWGIHNLDSFLKLLLFCQKNNIKIVISSSWRHLFKDYTYIEKMFESIFMNYAYIKRVKDKEDVVIGTTGYNKSRGSEILTWLSENKNLNIEDYLVVDDEIDYDIVGEIEERHLVRINNKVGLKLKDVKEIKQRLLGGK